MGLLVPPIGGPSLGPDPWSWLLELFGNQNAATGGKPLQEQVPGGVGATQTGPNTSEMMQNGGVNPNDLRASAAAQMGIPTPQAPMIPAGLDSKMVPPASVPGIPPEVLPQQQPGLSAGSPLPSSMGEALGLSDPVGQIDPATGQPVGEESKLDQLKQALGAVKAPSAPETQRISSPGVPQARPQQSGLLELLLASKQRAAETNPLLRLSQLLGRGG